jgi:hypothetical protein
MGSPFLGHILTSMIAGETPAKTPDAELEPILPGAWAAWAKAADDATAAAAATPAPKPATGVRRVRAAHGLNR